MWQEVRLSILAVFVLLSGLFYIVVAIAVSSLSLSLLSDFRSASSNKASVEHTVWSIGGICLDDITDSSPFDLFWVM
jgi:Co/Zn/Cd efflux system component